MRASADLYINPYSTKATGKHSVSIKVYFKRQRRYYPVNADMSEEDFNMITSDSKGKLPKNLKSEKEYLDDVLTNARKICKDLADGFTFQTFQKLFYRNSGSVNSVANAFADCIATMPKAQVGNKEVYKRAMISFRKFKENMKLHEITPQLLHDYEDSMVASGNSRTTVGIYARCLRKILNDAIENKIISKELYPFGPKGYEIPTAKKSKKSLTLEEVGWIVNYEAMPGSNTERCRDFWVFIYLANGINVSDFCRLRRSNLGSNTITFIRQKTKRTKRDYTPIVISRNEVIDRIIKKYEQKIIGKDPYIFPYLSDGLPPEEEIRIIKNLTWLINKYMKIIVKELGIDKDVTTYYARHSFATILKNSGAPVAMISEMFGHGSITTTQAYLDSFETDQTRKATEVLLNFSAKKGGR